MAGAEDGCAQASWFGKVGDTYNMLWKMVIRPPRDLYSPEELGPAKFRLGKRVYERRDLQLRSSRGVLECSHFVPAKSPEAKRPCVVYLHGNCSSRLEAFDALPVLLPRDLTVFCLDLSGSGRSEGEYISLGHHEEKDLRVVLQHLRSQENVSSIGLWGRSMGATTSILRAAEDADLAACVLDSAFRDLRTVAEELVNRGRFPVPAFLLVWALDMIRTEVLTRAAFDPLELMPINCAPLARCPALFGVASDDTFVLPHHTQDLHNAWAGERVLRVFEGGHNGVRPTWFLEEAADFLLDRLTVKGEALRDSICRSSDQAPDLDRPFLTTGPRAAPSGRTARGDREDDDEASDEEGKPTPRLVSPLTERLQLDADSAAGPVPSALTAANIPRSRMALAMELAKMGFGTETVVQAARECSTLEDALDWLHRHPSGTLMSHYEVGRPAGRRSPAMSIEGGGSSPSVAVRKLAQPPPRPASPCSPPAPAAASALARDASPPPGPPRRVGPPGASLAQQLRFLGFSDAEVDSASKRSLSLEAAMEYLYSQRVTVHL
mmetsp:Transcript_148661/g.477356  ORF Transcript_148661/g.477356 Transcript_148661/m.477356 type:complete len:550 (-) Transcript_148661:70-1719(-)